MDRTRAKVDRRLLPALCASLVLAGSLLMAWPAAAAELVMFRVPGCSWCQTWDREVGEIYAKSPEAKVAPLREVRLDKDRDGGLELKSGVRFTPTFVLAREGVEVGRITGYPGEAFFWSQLEALIEQLEQERRRPTSGAGDGGQGEGT